MRDSDDTRVHEVVRVADLTPDGGHYVGVVDDGRVVGVMTEEHARAHHSAELERGEYEVVIPRNPRPRPQQELAAGDGPAQVASDAYRDGWERIFGRKQPAGEA